MSIRRVNPGYMRLACHEPSGSRPERSRFGCSIVGNAVFSSKESPLWANLENTDAQDMDNREETLTNCRCYAKETELRLDAPQ
jgi:hypothetical protein